MTFGKLELSKWAERGKKSVITTMHSGPRRLIGVYRAIILATRFLQQALQEFNTILPMKTFDNADGLVS